VSQATYPGWEVRHEAKNAQLTRPEWLDPTSPLLETQIVASGLSGALNEALRDRLADMGAHPTVRERGIPAAAVWITETGRKAIASP
jgi:hypothetical protein